MRILVFSFLAFVAGAAGGWCAALGVYLVQTNWLGQFDRDGGGAMATAFVIGPALGLAVGVTAAAVTAVRMIGAKRRREARDGDAGGEGA